MPTGIEWTFDESQQVTCPCDVATVNGHTVRVSLFDEGPILPAFWWEIDSDHPDVETFPAGRILHDVWLNGWESTIERARRAAVNAARELEPPT